MHDTREITIEELLNARELRTIKQKELINTYKTPLVSFMVNYPSKYKDTPLTRKLHNEGKKILLQELESKNIPIIHNETFYKVTGTETFINVDIEHMELKKMLVIIENNHPLGRLFDYDVIDKEYNIISRTSLNQMGRKCLICDENASVCARSQKHDYQELINTINSIAKNYFNAIK